MKGNSHYRSAFGQPKKNHISQGSEREVIDFSSAEMALGGPPPVLKDVLSSISLEELSHYPDFSCTDLKNDVASFFGVEPNQVGVGAGTDPILDRLVQVFVEPGEPLLAPVPTFFRHLEAARKMKVALRPFPLSWDEGFSLTGDTFDNFIREVEEFRPKLIWLVTPNSPSGMVIPKENIRLIADLAPGIVAVDEVYQELYDLDGKSSSVGLLENHPNLVVLKGLSKTFCVPGIRCGFALGHPDVISKLERWRPLFDINAVTMPLARACLSESNYLVGVAEELRIVREGLFEQIKSLPGLQGTFGSQCNLFVLRHEQVELFPELLKRGVKAACMNSEPGLEGLHSVRVSVQEPEKNERLIQALREICSEENAVRAA